MKESFHKELNWPKDAHERGLEVVDQNSLYFCVAKPIRLTKPGRDLWSVTSKELQSILPHSPIYVEDVAPDGISGQHFHDKKIEFFWALDNFELYLWDLKTGEKQLLRVSKRTPNTAFGYLIRPGVAHAFKNVSGKIANYLIISNMFEEEAIAAGDIKTVRFDFSQFK